MKITTVVFLGITVLSVIAGCGSGEPTAVTDGVEQSAIDEYKAQIKAEEKAQAAAMAGDPHGK